MGDLLAALVLLLAPRADPCDVLAALDLVRAEAWTRGDSGLLATVYEPEAGRTDVDRLERWRARGIGLRDMTTTRAACRRVDEATVRVTERLGPAVAVLPDGTRRALPRDGWDVRTVSLRWTGRWRVTAVR